MSGTAEQVIAEAMRNWQPHDQHGAVRVVETRTLSDEYIATCEEFWQRGKALNGAKEVVR